ncbi:non-heme iron oxygenase ferredoxin subunit [Pseudochelatococcus sp. B33]
MSESVDWIEAASVADAAESEMLPVELNGRSLALYHVNGEWFCTDNICSHAYALLTDGWLDDYTVECPLHNGQFDIRTGRGLCAPIEEDISTFPVRVEGEKVLVGLPAGERRD